MALAPDRAAIKALEDALAAVLATVGNNPSPAIVRRIREGLAAHADAVEAARSATDPTTPSLSCNRTPAQLQSLSDLSTAIEAQNTALAAACYGEHPSGACRFGPRELTRPRD